MCLSDDTQLLIGGRHKKYTLSEDEYIFAALALFLDIFNLCVVLAFVAVVVVGSSECWGWQVLVRAGLDCVSIDFPG